MLKRTKQKSQGIWADPRRLRHQVRTKTKLSDLLTLSNCTLSEPEIAEQCLRVPWWGLYWCYNASVVSIFLKIFKRRPISTQLSIKEGGGKNKKRKHLCFYLIFLYWIYRYTYCLFFNLFHYPETRLLRPGYMSLTPGFVWSMVLGYCCEEVRVLWECSCCITYSSSQRESILAFVHLLHFQKRLFLQNTNSIQN